MNDIATPGLSFVCDLHVLVSEPIVVGTTTQGTRRVIPIVGGTVEGPRLRGRVLTSGGADYQMVRSDLVADVHARYALESDAGSLVYVENTGVRHGPPALIEKLNRGEQVDPSQIYFRTAPRFETADPTLAWMTRTLFIASGIRLPDAVLLRVFEVL